jgi:hypothetical protein
MAMELEALVGRIWRRPPIEEDACAILDQTVNADERPYGPTSLIVRVQLQQRLRPEAAAGIETVDLVLEFRAERMRVKERAKPV